MNQSMKKYAGVLLRLLIIFLALLGSFLVYISVNDFDPPARIKLDVMGPGEDVLADSREFTFLSWNIGYAGLGKEMDFFYDGGVQVRPEQDQFNTYWTGICSILTKLDTIDFILLQEVDMRSKRSYFTDQKDSISSIFNEHYESFAVNYDVKVVPVPLLDPLGKVKAGIMSLSKYKPVLAERIAYPNIASWPKKLFLLDRCFIAMKIPLGENDLLVLNTHNSFYVKEPELRQKELDIIREYMLNEFRKGNYVVAGGDWNQNPPELPDLNFESEDHFQRIMKIDTEFLPEDWKYACDKRYPSNRNLDEKYIKGKTPTTIIDYFILSPNVKDFQVRTIPMEFKYSDHQPVILTIEIK